MPLIHRCKLLGHRVYLQCYHVVKTEMHNDNITSVVKSSSATHDRSDQLTLVDNTQYHYYGLTSTTWTTQVTLVKQFPNRRCAKKKQQ